MKMISTATMLTLVAVAASFLVAAPSQAQSTMTYSPLTGIGVGPNGPAGAKIKTEPYCCPSDALLVTASQLAGEDDFQWVNLGLSVPGSTQGGQHITAVEVCYEIKAARPEATYISQTRLSDMTTPNVANVGFDDPTDRKTPGPTCYTVKESFTPKGTVTLALKVVFANTQDEIRIGMVRIYLD
jgi:hypothetical protein